jgi:hypothetical protein
MEETEYELDLLIYELDKALKANDFIMTGVCGDYETSLVDIAAKSTDCLEDDRLDLFTSVVKAATNKAIEFGRRKSDRSPINFYYAILKTA